MSDQWNFYPCKVDDQPASIYLDLGIQEEVPMRDLDTLTWLRLHMRTPRDDGLSSQQESETLWAIEDALNAALEDEETDARYVGRNTSDGCRDFYYYSSNGSDTERRLSMAMVPFPGYEFETGSRSDAEWSAYLDFLYPSPRSYQVMMNQDVLYTLEQQGDVPEVPREITHWIFFRFEHQRTEYRDRVTKLGYEILEEEVEEEGDHPFKLVIVRVSPADFVTVNDAVLELYDLAVEFEADYDGWETSVEKAADEAD